MVDNTESEIEPITPYHADVEIFEEWVQAMMRAMCDFFAKQDDESAEPCGWPDCGCTVATDPQAPQMSRAAITAISPLIQARERERCAADSVRAFMDGIDWEHHLGHDAKGAKLFPSAEVTKREKKCLAAGGRCGIVEVEVRLIRWVEPQDLDAESSALIEAARGRK